MNGFAERPRRKSIRLQDYSYSKSGYYFITICCEDGNPYFENDRVRKAAEECWLSIPEHFVNVRLDAYVIMPNHVHGIIVIHRERGRDTPWRVPTFGPLTRNSLSSMVNQYKSTLKRWCNKNGCRYFKWQARYYDHVIRNDRELFNIRKYIVENPFRWNLDAENPENRHGKRRICLDKYYSGVFEG